MMITTTKSLAEEHTKEQILEIGRLLYQRNYVVSNDGNITVMTQPGTVWTTPTGVSKGSMTADMLVKVDLDGNVLEGSYRPSSELKMHLRVYSENPHVTAVVHAHPTCATAFAIAGIALDEPVLIEAILQLGPVPVAHYAKPGTYDVPDSIALFCRDYNAVLLSNHGALTWGASLQQAFDRMEVLETYARTLMNLKALGGGRPLSQKQIDGLSSIRQGLGVTGRLPAGGHVEENALDVLPKISV